MLMFLIYLGLNVFLIKLKLHYSFKLKLALSTFYIFMSILGICVWQINKGLSSYLCVAAIFVFSQGIDKVIRLYTTQKILKEIRKNEV